MPQIFEKHGENPDYNLWGLFLTIIKTNRREILNHFVLSFLFWQSALGAEGISLEFRHIATYLIWYCSHFVSCEDLLHEIILIVGYFTILNTDNQVCISTVFYYKFRCKIFWGTLVSALYVAISYLLPRW